MIKINNQKNKSLPIILGLVLLKTKTVFFKLLKLIKGFKSYKIAGAAGSTAAYTGIYNWKFAAILLTMIGFHEYGHVIAMKITKMKTRGFYFVPFFGGMAVPDEDFKTRNQEAYVALMGPVFGLVLTAASFLAFYLTQNVLFAAIAILYAFINLFNLAPINPLDGGRVLKSLVFSAKHRGWKWFSFISLFLGIFVAFKIGASLLSYFLFLGILDLIGAARRKIPKMDKNQKIGIIASYFAITGLLYGVIHSITAHFKETIEETPTIAIKELTTHEDSIISVYFLKLISPLLTFLETPIGFFISKGGYYLIRILLIILFGIFLIGICYMLISFLKRVKLARRHSFGIFESLDAALGATVYSMTSYHDTTISSNTLITFKGTNVLFSNDFDEIVKSLQKLGAQIHTKVFDNEIHSVDIIVIPNKLNDITLFLNKLITDGV